VRSGFEPGSLAPTYSSDANTRHQATPKHICRPALNGPLCKLAYMVQSVAWYFAWMVNFASEGFILQITLLF